MKKEKKSSSLSFAGSILGFSLATWINALLYAISVMLVNIYVDKGVFGLFDLMITASTTLMSVVTLGFDHAYLRFFNEPPKGAVDRKQIAALGLIVSITVLAVVSVLIFLLPDAIGRIFFEGRREIVLLVSLCITTLCMVVIRFFNITYRMQNNILLFTVVSILLQFFTRVFFIFGVFIHDDFRTIAIFNLCGLCAFVLVFLFLERKQMLPKKYGIQKEAYAPLFKYSLGIMPSSVLLWGNQLVNKLFIGAYLGEAALGLFSFAALISQALSILQGGFANFWSAYMFSNYEKERERIMKVHDLLVCVMMFLICLLIIVSPLIFIVLSKFSESRRIFSLLLAAPLLMIIAETTVYGIEIAKKTILNSISSLICVVTNILSCILLVPSMKLTGAALSLVISTLAMFTFRTIMAQRLYRTIRSYTKTTLSLLFIAFLITAAYIFDSNYIIILIISLFTLLIYAFIYMKEIKTILLLLQNYISKEKTQGSSTE